MAKPSSSKPNYFYSIISVTLVLLLLGLFGLIVIQGQQAVVKMKEQVEIIVELIDGNTQAHQDELMGFLEKSVFYKPESAVFISKEEGAEMMQEEFGESFLKLDMANPLYDVLTFNMNAAYMEANNIEDITSRIKGFGFVNDVYYQETVADAIASNLKKISYGVLVAGIFFIIVAIALILNTIRLALYSNRFLIKNMELVGASWNFISRPFLRRSFVHGLICGILAIIILGLIIHFVFSTALDGESMLQIPMILLLFLGLLMTGITITVLSTYFVVNKYLKMRVDEMY